MDHPLPKIPLFTVDPKSISKILLIHPFGIGDALFITPVIRLLKRNGVKEVDLLLGSRTKDLFDQNPYVNRVFEWDKSALSGFGLRIKRWLSVARLFFRIWMRRYNAMIDFSPRAQYSVLGFFIFWIKYRIGFNFKHRAFFLNHSFDLPEGYHERHVAEYYGGMLKCFGIPFEREKTDLFLSDEDIRSAERVLSLLGIDLKKPYFAVSPGGGESWGKDARLKQWPVSHFVRLLKLIFGKGAHPIFDFLVLVGGPHDIHLADEIIAELRGTIPAYNLCGRMSLRQSAAVIQKASFFIGNDGGLIHVAHAVNTPLVAFYGPVDPKVYGPYPPDLGALTVTCQGPACRPCYQRFKYQEACKGVECLTHLTPDQVWEKIQNSGLLDRFKIHARA